jgi:hypothetical protein
MITVACFTAVYVLGLVWSLALGRHLGAGVCCLLAYPLGLFLWVLVGLVPATLPVPYQPATLATEWLAAFALGALLARRAGAFTGDSAALGGAVLLFAALVVGLVLFDASVWTFDSHVILAIGRALAHHGGITPELAPDLASRGVFQILVQAPSLFLGHGSLWFTPSLFAVCFYALFALLAARALFLEGTGPARVQALVGLTVLAMLSHYWLLLQALYVHDGFAAASYLCLFTACFWLGEREREPAWVAFAHLFLLALALQRIEMPLVAMAFLGIAHTRSRLSATLLNRWLLATTLLLLLWLAALAHFWEPGPTLLHPQEQHIVSARTAWLAGAVIAFGALAIRALQLPRLARVRRRAPALLLAGALLALLAAFVLDGETRLKESAMLLGNMVSSSWGALWVSFALLGLLAPLLPRLPFHPIFSVGALVYLVGMFLYARGTHPGWGDSGNRALTHLVPMLFFFFLLVYGRESEPARAEGAGEVEYTK